MTEDDIDDIHQLCRQYKIKNYKINDDMSIDVDGDVNLLSKNLTKIPLKFSKVTGDFDCFDNNVTSLERCPVYTTGNFVCISNKLTSLCGLPVNFYIGGDFCCGGNTITDVKEFSKILFGTIIGGIYTDNTKLDRFLNNNKNPPKKDLPRLLSELRKIQL